MEVSVPVSRIAFGGDGVGRLPGGKVCFIPGALPGETVRAEITHEAKSFARAKALEVLTASPRRVAPDCPLAGTCPGCVYRHADYDCELEWKTRQFTDFLTRGNPAAGAAEFLPPLGAPARNGCRNKLTFVCENGAFCYRGLDNRTAVPVSDCLLGHPDIRGLLAAAEPSADGQKRTFRRTLHDGALDSGSEAWRRIAHLTEQLGRFGDFRVPKASFFQVNPDMAPASNSTAVRGSSPSWRRKRFPDSRRARSSLTGPRSTRRNTMPRATASPDNARSWRRTRARRSGS